MLGESALCGPRYDEPAQFVVTVHNGKRRWCAGDNCISSVRTQCSKRDIGMCIP